MVLMDLTLTRDEARAVAHQLKWRLDTKYYMASLFEPLADDVLLRLETALDNSAKD